MFLVGLAFGSFLNVCISRFPRDQSVVTPRSHCPRCEAAIAWYDNVPVVSWLFLRGRCRQCGSRISFRYPTVEMLTALLFLWCYASFGLGWMLAKACIFTFLVVGLIFADTETGLLPAEFTYSGIVAGLLLSWFAPVDASASEFLIRVFEGRAVASQQTLSVLDAVAGALFGATFFYLVWALYYLVRRVDGVGFGDVAFAAMIGAFLGLKLTILVVFFSPIMATLFAIIFMLPMRRVANDAQASQVNQLPQSAGFLHSQIPFGVFLGISALVALFFGEPIWQWYLAAFR